MINTLNKSHTKSNSSNWNTIVTISNRINTSIRINRINSSNKKTMIKITITKTITQANTIKAAIMTISDLSDYYEYIYLVLSSPSF